MHSNKLLVITKEKNKRKKFEFQKINPKNNSKKNFNLNQKKRKELTAEINERDLGVDDTGASRLRERNIAGQQQKKLLIKASIVRFGTHQNRPYERKRTSGLVSEKIPITWPLDKVTIVSIAQSRRAQCHDVYQHEFRDVKLN